MNGVFCVGVIQSIIITAYDWSQLRFWTVCHLKKKKATTGYLYIIVFVE